MTQEPKKNRDKPSTPAPSSEGSEDQKGATTATKKPLVGYKQPPVETRYKPGQSGNPSGRAKNPSTDVDPARTLADELTAKVTLTENGRRKKLPYIVVIIKRMITSAAHGDPKAQNNLFRCMKMFQLPPAGKDQAASTPDYGAEIRAKLENMARNTAEFRQMEEKRSRAPGSGEA